MADWTQFPAWKRFLAKNEGIASPFQKEVIGPKSLFLYSEMTAPLPSGATAGMWFAYPGAQELVAHLRFAVLPNVFGIWLCRDEWAKEETPVDLATLFVEAREHGSRYAADLPVMERIAALLDEAASTKRPQVAQELAERAIRTFNRRWRNTPSWAFRLQLFDTIEKVTRDIAKRNSCTDLDPKAFKKLAGQVLTDPKAERVFRKVLAEAGVI